MDGALEYVGEKQLSDDARHSTQRFMGVFWPLETLTLWDLHCDGIPVSQNGRTETIFEVVSLAVPDSLGLPSPTRPLKQYDLR